MASIRKERTVAASAASVWNAIRRVDNADKLFPAVIASCRLEGGIRFLEFSNGMAVQEKIVTVDDAERRFVWAAFGGMLSHHNGALHVLEDGDACRVVWVTDLQPDELREPIEALMEAGIASLKQSLETMG